MSDETEVQAVDDPNAAPAEMVNITPAPATELSGPAPVVNPTAVHGVLENIEAEWAKFKDFFEAKIADIRSHL